MPRRSVKLSCLQVAALLTLGFPPLVSPVCIYVDIHHIIILWRVYPLRLQVTMTKYNTCNQKNIYIYIIRLRPSQQHVNIYIYNTYIAASNHGTPLSSEGALGGLCGSDYASNFRTGAVVWVDGLCSDFFRIIIRIYFPTCNSWEKQNPKDLMAVEYFSGVASIVGGFRGLGFPA